MNYSTEPGRYESMAYTHCGNSGLKLPRLSLGLWHNFGADDDLQNCRILIQTAFDNGITHFDLANNYGPPPGAAEITFGKVLKLDLHAYRDELVISTKAGYNMWPGPYGEWGSRKHLTASLDQSLKRTGLEYVDIFYHHRPDPATPLEETMRTLDGFVRGGKALYIGVSSYSPEETAAAVKILDSLGTPLLVHQPKYSMLERGIENGLLDTLENNKIGCICFSPLAQGLLTDKYLNGIPSYSRAASHRGNGALEPERITASLLAKIKRLNMIAGERGQSLAQMALAWVLKDKRVSSVIIGASRKEQILDSLKGLSNRHFTETELNTIESVLQSQADPS